MIRHTSSARIEFSPAGRARCFSIQWLRRAAGFGREIYPHPPALVKTLAVRELPGLQRATAPPRARATQSLPPRAGQLVQWVREAPAVRRPEEKEHREFPESSAPRPGPASDSAAVDWFPR